MDSELMSQEEEDEFVSGLRDAGHHVQLIRGVHMLLESVSFWRKQCDIVFNRSVGYRGRDRALQAPAILDAAGIPHVGSSPYVHELVHNKYHAKLIAAAAGVATPRASVVWPGRKPDLAGVTFPAIVKLLSEGSSIGIEFGRSVVATPAEAVERAAELMVLYDQPVIVETFVCGIEVEVPLLIGGTCRPLGAVAITVAGGVVSGDDYLAADVVNGDRYGFTQVPSLVDTSRLLAAATRVSMELGLRDYGRIDFRVSSDGTPWFIEAESLPHLQRHSSFFALAKERGLEYHEMLDEVLSVAFSRVRESC